MRSALLCALLLPTLAFAANAYEAAAGSATEYMFSPVTTVPVADGRVTVALPNGLTAPSSGYFPFWVDTRNSTMSPQKFNVRVVSSNGGGIFERDIELKGGESRRVFLPIPTSVTGASVEISGPNVQERSGVYFSSYLNTSILAIGSEDAFRDFVGKGPSTASPDVSVLVLPPSELPEDLSAYIGFSGVVLLDKPIEALTEGQRRVLEQYAATGGLLAIERKSRGVDQYLPMSREQKGDDYLHYGYGKVLPCDPERSGCGGRFMSLAYTAGIPVKPVGPAPSYARGPFRSSYYYTDRPAAALLAQAAPPVGRFLIIMILFTLAVGPGSLYVARKRGPLFVLITVPSIALLTCVSIALYSAAVDGFQVHATTRGYTLLDRNGDRAITVSLEAFYANLAPAGAQFGTGDAILFPPDRYSSQSASITWEGGPHFGGDFIPSRTYREWGAVSVSPTRARLSIKNMNVLNALGGHVKSVLVRKDGRYYEATDIRDGGEAKLTETRERTPGDLTDANDRFAANVPSAIRAPLRDGEFVAVLDGPGPSALGGVRTVHEGDQHLIRGEAD